MTLYFIGTNIRDIQFWPELDTLEERKLTLEELKDVCSDEEFAKLKIFKVEVTEVA